MSTFSEVQEVVNSELIRRLSEQRVTLRGQLAEQVANVCGRQTLGVNEVGARLLLFHAVSGAGVGVQVQAAGLRGLDEGQKVSFDVAMERGKSTATNLKPA